jgi:demethylmenaquinone methyltransferase/2-methoxy-6-polyprenyl-1,4-benzoquinol methylase
MFARIAGRYDLLNRTLSAGIDRRWRRRTVRAAGEVSGRLVLDACCGTGDLARDFARSGARVVGVDFTPEMLAHAGPKLADLGPSFVFVHGDALRLPLPDDGVDVASVAFGLRNLADPDVGLRELARVVRPGGVVLVLEFTTPPGRLLGALYRLYFTRILPRIGGVVSGDAGAYRYLPDTVLAWPTPDQLRQRMAAAGLVDCGFELLSGGIACLHRGRVPAGDRGGGR